MANMGLYNYLDQVLDKIYDHNSNPLSKAYNTSGNVIWEESEEPIKPEEPFVPYTFAVISDAHYQTNMPDEKAKLDSLCTYLAANMPDMIIASGDLSNGTNYSSTLSAFSNAGIPCKYDVGGNKLHWAWGNHENNASRTLDELRKSFKDAVGTGASDSHYFDMNGDRFIILHFRNMSGKRAQFTLEDLTTLQEALNTAGDMRVFLIEHCPDYDDRTNRPMCGDYGKHDSQHWNYAAEGLEWNGTTMDARDIYRSILDTYVASHPNRLIWLHGHTHKPVAYSVAGFDGSNSDTTYFHGKGWTVHIPSLGRPQKKEGYVTNYGEWAAVTVSKDSVLVQYHHVEGTTVNASTDQHLTDYDITIPCAAS